MYIYSDNKSRLMSEIGDDYDVMIGVVRKRVVISKDHIP